MTQYIPALSPTHQHYLEQKFHYQFHSDDEFLQFLLEASHLVSSIVTQLTPFMEHLPKKETSPTEKATIVSTVVTDAVTADAVTAAAVTADDVTTDVVTTDVVGDVVTADVDDADGDVETETVCYIDCYNVSDHEDRDDEGNRVAHTVDSAPEPLPLISSPPASAPAVPGNSGTCSNTPAVPGNSGTCSDTPADPAPWNSCSTTEEPLQSLHIPTQSPHTDTVSPDCPPFSPLHESRRRSSECSTSQSGSTPNLDASSPNATAIPPPRYRRSSKRRKLSHSSEENLVILEEGEINAEETNKLRKKGRKKPGFFRQTSEGEEQVALESTKENRKKKGLISLSTERKNLIQVIPADVNIPDSVKLQSVLKFNTAGKNSSISYLARHFPPRKFYELQVQKLNDHILPEDMRYEPCMLDNKREKLIKQGKNKRYQYTHFMAFPTFVVHKLMWLCKNREIDAAVEFLALRMGYVHDYGVMIRRWRKDLDLAPNMSSPIRAPSKKNKRKEQPNKFSDSEVRFTNVLLEGPSHLQFSASSSCAAANVLLEGPSHIQFSASSSCAAATENLLQFTPLDEIPSKILSGCCPPFALLDQIPKHIKMHVLLLHNDNMIKNYVGGYGRIKKGHYHNQASAGVRYLHEICPNARPIGTQDPYLFYLKKWESENATEFRAKIREIKQNMKISSGESRDGTNDVPSPNTIATGSKGKERITNRHELKAKKKELIANSKSVLDQPPINWVPSNQGVSVSVWDIPTETAPSLARIPVIKARKKEANSKPVNWAPPNQELVTAQALASIPVIKQKNPVAKPIIKSTPAKSKSIPVIASKDSLQISSKIKESMKKQFLSLHSGFTPAVSNISTETAVSPPSVSRLDPTSSLQSSNNTATSDGSSNNPDQQHLNVTQQSPTSQTDAYISSSRIASDSSSSARNIFDSLATEKLVRHVDAPSVVPTVKLEPIEIIADNFKVDPLSSTQTRRDSFKMSSKVKGNVKKRLLGFSSTITPNTDTSPVSTPVGSDTENNSAHQNQNLDDVNDSLTIAEDTIVLHDDTGSTLIKLEPLEITFNSKSKETSNEHTQKRHKNNENDKTQDSDAPPKHGTEETTVKCKVEECLDEGLVSFSAPTTTISESDVTTPNLPTDTPTSPSPSFSSSPSSDLPSLRNVSSEPRALTKVPMNIKILCLAYCHRIGNGRTLELFCRKYPTFQIRNSDLFVWKFELMSNEKIAGAIKETAAKLDIEGVGD